MEKFRHEVTRAIQICEKEIIERKKGVVGESTLEELEEVVLPELKMLLSKIDKNEIPRSKEKRFLISYANAFTVWGWDMQEPTELFLLLATINDQYKEL